MKNSTLTIATRESPLALWQAEWVQKRLQTIHPHLKVQLLGLTTQADQILDIPLTEVGGKGLFVKELEEALLDGRADIAVHSMKDVPMFFPDGLCLPVICEREDPRDVFVSNDFTHLAEVPMFAKIGTSSFRRQCQVKSLREDIEVIPLRGNVNTRLAKLDRKDYAAIILAAAGLLRLGLKERIRSFLPIEECLPAAGQGALGIECRVDDEEIRNLIAPLNHSETAFCIAAERAMCTHLGGGCQVPVAAFAHFENNQLTLQGRVGKIDGSLILRSTFTDSVNQAEILGINVAKALIAQGAEEILKSVPSK